MRKQVVALVGSRSVIGETLKPISSKFTILEHSSIDWGKPEKALRQVSKGNPDAYIICYSAFDEVEGRLLEIFKIIKKAAKPSKAKIIGFATTTIFEGNEDGIPYDEEVVPYPTTDSGKAQLLYEEHVLKYPNSVMFRLGELWGYNSGIIRRLFAKMIVDVCECSDDKVFSLLSHNTLRNAVCKVIADDIVFYYNLADVGEVSELELAQFLASQAQQHGFIGKVRQCEGESYSVLDTLRWETMSMTTGICWDKLVSPAIPEVLKALHAA